MKLTGYIILSLFWLGALFQIGEHVIAPAVREVQADVFQPTKGQGFVTHRLYDDEYNKQAHRLR